jgi:hypothetical protein
VRANFLTIWTAWDLRAALRAFAGALLALAVVWLITAATDEGQLGFGERAGRTLPLAPLCSAVGVALALGTARVRAEVRALEALGRSPGESSRAAAFGAAVPSVVMAAAIALAGSVDVGGFYPRAPRSDTFVRVEGAFIATSLGVRVGDDGETAFADADAEEAPPPDASLPRFARGVAATTTGIAGVALTLGASRAVLRPSLSDRRSRRRSRARAASLVFGCVLSTLIAFQAAAAGIAPALIAVVPPALLLVLEVAQRWRRLRYGSLA